MIPFRPRNRPASYFAAVALYPIIAIFSGLGLIGKLQLVHRILPLPLPILSTVVIVWILLPLAWLPALRARRLLAPLVLLGVVIASLFIYPKMAQLQKTGRGSDQPDCIIVAAKGIAATEWPYDKAKMWSGDPMSCGPGWVLLQTPATILAGYRWNLLILWLAAFLILRQRLSYKVVAGFFTLLGLAVVTWVAASDGTDFLPFGILVAALFVVLQTPSRLTIGYLMLLTLLVQFRFPMLILPVLLLPSKRLISAVISSVSALLFPVSPACVASRFLHLRWPIAPLLQANQEPPDCFGSWTRPRRSLPRLRCHAGGSDCGP